MPHIRYCHAATHKSFHVPSTFCYLVPVKAWFTVISAFICSKFLSVCKETVVETAIELST